jgi:hypothetical protein
VSRTSANARTGVRAVRSEAGCGSDAEPNGSTDGEYALPMMARQKLVNEADEEDQTGYICKE